MHVQLLVFTHKSTVGKIFLHIYTSLHVW